MYFTQAWNLKPWRSQSKEYTNSRAYDFDSIMHYPLSLKIGKGAEPPYVLLRHKKDLSHGEPTDPENLIYQGGNRNPKQAGPTEMDINRIKALYPRKPRSANTQSPCVDAKPERGDDEKPESDDDDDDDDDKKPESGDEKPGTATDKPEARCARRRVLHARLSLEPDHNDDHEADQSG